jgi:hypothetical protein
MGKLSLAQEERAFPFSDPQKFGEIISAVYRVVSSPAIG